MPHGTTVGPYWCHRASRYHALRNDGEREHHRKAGRRTFVRSAVHLPGGDPDPNPNTDPAP
jgi:hypothetical protein